MAFSVRSVGTVHLEGKAVAVTGGGGGLGRVLVEVFARAGAHVAFSYHQSRAGAEQAETALREAGGRVMSRPADARVPGEIATFVEAAAECLGGLDILINNAGVFQETPLGEITEGQIDEAFDVNVKAAIIAVQAAAPHMRRRGGGAVVNVASLGGLRPWPSHVAYCASKAALIMATRCLAVALAPDVRVNAVAPGILERPGTAETVRRRIPLDRFGTDAEAAEAVLFLATAAGYTTGEVLNLDGGRSLR